MPTYDYECKSCSHVFEQVKKISDRDNTSDTVCPECSQISHVQRLLSAPLIAYSVVAGGSYGTSVPDGFKDVLRKIDSRSPGSRMKETSAFL